jgi:molybdenum cofactor cytidylyltransferase
VTPATIDTIVTAWRTSRSWAAVTEYEHRELGHPFVFSSGVFATLRGLHGDKAVWKIVDTDSRVVRIPVDPSRPRDVDTWDDYVAVCDEFGVEPFGT